MSPNMFSVTITSNVFGPLEQDTAPPRRHRRGLSRRPGNSRRDLVEDLPEERHRRQDVGLVHQRDVLAPPQRASRNAARITRSAPARVISMVSVARSPPPDRAARLRRGEQPFGAFAHQDEIDVAGRAAAQRRIVRMEQIDRAQAAVEIQPLAQVELRRHLDAARPAHAGQAHRAEQDGVELAQPLEDALRQRIAALQRYSPAPTENSSDSRRDRTRAPPRAAPAPLPRPLPARCRRRAGARCGKSVVTRRSPL